MSNQSATIRDQYLHYDLIRSGRFNSNELAMLQVIATYSQRCELKQSELARIMNKSIATIRRTMNSLISKGIIVRTYTVFKRCVLKIKSLKEQKELMTGLGIIKLIQKRTKSLMKSNDRSRMNELNRSPMSEPTRSKTQEENFKANLNIFSETSQKIQGWLNEREFAQRKNEQLAAFKAQFNLNT